MTKTPEILTESFLTYNTKKDLYDLPQSYLGLGSKDTLIVEQNSFKSREGFTLQGASGTNGSKIEGSTEWTNSNGTELYLRSLKTELRLEVQIDGTWETLMSALSSTKLEFSPYYDSVEKIDRLLWADGSASVYDWSGAYAKLSAITATTVTCSGTNTFGQQRFLTTGTRAIRIKDSGGTWRRAAYTGGEGTTTLTGLDTDLTAFVFLPGALIVQEVITRANIVSSTFLVDYVDIINNQAWYGSRSSNSVYVSKDTDITSLTFSTPRAVGEGAQLVLDGPGRGICVLKGDVILFAGLGFIYKSVFNQITVGSSLAETLKVSRLKTTSRQGAIHHYLIEEMDNAIVWIGNDNVLYELVDATLAYNPTIAPLSDPIKPDFDATDFGRTSGNYGHVRFYKTRLFISAPASTKSFIYEYRIDKTGSKLWWWQPPQTLPVQRWAVISDLIHGHSSQASETYKMFDGLRDRAASDYSGGTPINPVAELGRWNGGTRKSLKNSDQHYVEGNIRANTKVTVTYKFDLDAGQQQSYSELINPTKNADIVYANVQDPSLGNSELGDVSLEGDVLAQTLSHYRINHEFNETEFFDYGVRFESNDLDQQWEVTALGIDAGLSPSKATGIGV